MKKIIGICALLTALCELGGCAKPPAATPAITGTLSYRTPVELGKDTVLELRLTDVSVSEGAAPEIARVTLRDVRALPYAYSLPYDPAHIDPAHRYTVDARLSSAGQLRFATDMAYEVLTQGHTTQRDVVLIAVGSNESTLPAMAQNQPGGDSFRGELRTAQGVSLYRAGLQDGSIRWLEEDRSNGTPQPLHARYEFKGALLTRYADSSSLEVNFDERGRPSTLTRQQHALQLNEHIDALNTIRNQAALLRSHALAVHEAQIHRQATGG